MGSEKNGMIGLPDGRKSFKIGLAVQTQYRRVTDIRPSSQPSFDSKDRVYALHRAGKKSNHLFYTPSLRVIDLQVLLLLLLIIIIYNAEAAQYTATIKQTKNTQQQSY